MPPTTPQSSQPSKGPSLKLRQMLKDATPQQREEAIRVTANLLALKAKKAKTKG
jgi:hypothetical protein